MPKVLQSFISCATLLSLALQSSSSTALVLVLVLVSLTHVSARTGTLCAFGVLFPSRTCCTAIPIGTVYYKLNQINRKQKPLGLGGLTAFSDGTGQARGAARAAGADLSTPLL